MSPPERTPLDPDFKPDCPFFNLLPVEIGRGQDIKTRGVHP
jgi:hypothetical protein